jgi:dCTP diphosphatase
MIDLEKIFSFQRKFVADREWERFHTPKNLACALVVEAGELLEVMQWLNEQELADIQSDTEKMKQIGDEISDVLYYLLRMVDVLGIDLEKAFWDKVARNAQKYPVELAKGNAKKYHELRKMDPQES